MITGNCYMGVLFREVLKHLYRQVRERGRVVTPLLGVHSPPPTELMNQQQ